VEKSIISQYRAMSGCSDPLILQLFSAHSKIDFIQKDLFHQTHVNNIVYLNRSRLFFSILFKRTCKDMGIVVRDPTPIEVPKDLKHTIAKDRKEVAAIDDAQEATAFNIDHDDYIELSAKPFLEMEEKLEVKKYNLATHYGVDPTEITPKFVKTFDKEKPRKMFGLTLKGKHVRTGNPNVFELKLMDCFIYDDGVMTLKLPSGKLIKSYLNKPKPLAPTSI